MIWKLFGSERRVEEALEQSVGYDISPNQLHMPANTDAAVKAQAVQEELRAIRPEQWQGNHAFMMPMNAMKAEDRLRLEEKPEKKKA